MATNELDRPLVNDDSGAPATRGARWPLFASVSAVVFGACIAVVWSTSGHAAAGAVFTEPSSLGHANAMLQNLPATMDQAELYTAHISPYLAIMYKLFLKHYGSSAERLQGNSSAVAAAKAPSASGTDFNRRLGFFGEAVKQIIQLNAEYSGQTGQARFALNQFADWSPQELQSILGDMEMIPEPEAPSANFTTARSSIMLTSNVCVDTADYCADWKRKGYCDISSKYHPFMSKNCKLSCEESSCGYWKGRGFCSRTSRHSAYVNKHCPCHCGDVEDDEQSMNWVEKYPDVFEVGFVQGCGSCWAHSALEMVRQMDGIKHIGQSLGLLSVQYLVDCVYPHSKCHCDWHCCCHGFTCLNWISAHGGVPLRETYGDYHSGSNPNTFHECRHVSPVVTTSGARWLHSEAEMARVMVGEGPIAIGIFANGAWYRYSGGSLPPTACASFYTNHAVQCVGYDNAAKVWIVMNSWGRQWGVSAKKPYSHIPGQSGFILLQYGHNTCNILRHPVIAQNVRRVDGFSLEFTEELVEAVPEGPEHQNFV